MMDIAAIVAAASHSRGIGANGSLVWKIPGDMAHFKRVTLQPPLPDLSLVHPKESIRPTTITSKKNVVIMGRKTWDSIPKPFRPLSDRINIILSRSCLLDVVRNAIGDNHPQDSIYVASSWKHILDILSQQQSRVGHIYVIGGEQVYKEGIDLGIIKKVIYTDIIYPGGVEEEKLQMFDSFFPELSKDEWSCHAFVPTTTETSATTSEDHEDTNADVDEDEKRNRLHHTLRDPSTATVHTDPKSGLQYRFLEYQRITSSTCNPKLNQSLTNVPLEGPHVNPEEMQYLNLCRDIIQNGIKRGDRTGTGTLSKFGTQMRFSLRNGTIPLLTTKRVFWRGVAEELLWFLKGNTNGNDLAAKDIHIWDGNGSREFLDSQGLHHRKVGDLGPVYGFQWRHFGATYVDMDSDYSNQGIDQLAECIDKIIHRPEDRRIIMTAWNPSDLNLMALPPCHMFVQFYVDVERNELSCQMYQRSADMGLGVPFNIASYALLTHLVAQVTGRKPGDFVHTIGDAHVYLNHVDALQQQLERQPRAFPKIKINPSKKNIDDFVFEDFEIVGYEPHKTIQMKMAV